MKPTKFTNEAELKALFDHAVRVVRMALESLRRALNNRPSNSLGPATTTSRDAFDRTPIGLNAL
jgi:hypothetical protein